VVDTIVTELAVMEVTPDGLLLMEIAPDTSVEAVLKATDAPLRLSSDFRAMEI